MGCTAGAGHANALSAVLKAPERASAISAVPKRSRLERHRVAFTFIQVKAHLESDAVETKIRAKQGLPCSEH